MEGKEEMKLSLIAFLLLSCGLLSAASYAELRKEADTLAAEKESLRALEKYSEAENAASTSGERLACILARNKLLILLKRSQEAAALLKSHLEDEKLADPELRRLVNTYASQIMWGSEKQKNEAFELLKTAKNLKTNIPYDEFTTGNLLAHIHAARKNYETAIELMRTVLSDQRTHPAILYSAALFSGQMYEKLGRTRKALEYYRKAVEYGRKVVYKFDYSAAEQAAERLSK